MKKVLFTILGALSLCATGQSSKVNLNWQKNIVDLNVNQQKVELPYFKGAFYPSLDEKPKYTVTYSSNKKLKGGEIILNNQVWEAVTNDQTTLLSKFSKASEPIKLVTNHSGNESFLNFQIPALRFNANTNEWEKLISFEYDVKPQLGLQIENNFFRSGETSPMNEGTWIKIGVTSTGVQKLSKSFFESNGIAVNSVDPKNIRVFGYSEGMLPEDNFANTPATLPEIPSLFQGEGDGSFDDSDFLLFHAKAADVWEFNESTKEHYHEKHLYADTAYYFINIGSTAANRIQTTSEPAGAPTHFVNTYDYLSFYEVDNTNLIKTGREWYGDYFDFTLKYTYNYSIPNRPVGEKVHFKARMAVRATTTTGNNMHFYANGSKVHSRNSISNVSTSYTANYAQIITEKDSFDLSGNSLSFEIEYDQPNGASAWLDYLEIEANCDLAMQGNSFQFNNKKSIGTGNISEFTLSNASSNLIVWDITNPYDIKDINYNLSGGDLTFKTATDSLKTFIAFTTAGTKTPFFSGITNNQNLTSLTDIDYILITPSALKSPTQDLANFHENNSGLTTAVVDIQEIYNEFSGGTKDITAIRNFLRYLYNNANSSSTRLKYVFLMGDGSYDPKYRTLNNTNFIPTFQSSNSISPTASFVSDDYYAMLDDVNSIYSSSSSVDIGVGRFPARNLSDATGFVNKVKHYVNTGQMVTVSSGSNAQIKTTYGDWKNKAIFVADDGSASDGYTSAHMLQTEMVIDALLDQDSVFNINKIYMDAYVKESTAGGGRYPDVKREIREAVESGAFLISYIGHGGEAGWADERVLDVDAINNWTNMDGMPLFLTATCEFSRFDDPERTAAGEYVILNPNGGAIAMLTTTRLVYGGISNNIGFSINFFEELLDGSYPTIGDAVRLTKVNSPLGSNYNNRKFSLLGDPAMKLSYPRYNVVTTKINGVDIANLPDTLKALSKIKIEGEIRDASNQLENINGFVYTSIYDKLSNVTTLDNNNANNAITYDTRSSLLYKGISSVNSGKFSVEFIVPKDINYGFGNGRISYYFANDTTNGAGYDERAIVGGSSTSINSDTDGPQVQLFMNDTNFIFGGTTNESPNLFAVIKDESGINTTGNSLGHDVTAVLDEDYSGSIVLNDFYSATLDDFTSGTITYPFSELSEGKHTLKLKLWDANNNSGEAFTEFVVANEADLALNHVLNYPNPFTTSTNFYFEHNQPNQNLDVLIKIFTISGRLVKSISTEIMSTGNLKPSPIPWDGLDDYGDKIGRGVYLYQVEVQTPDGKKADKLEKLVILR